MYITPAMRKAKSMKDLHIKIDKKRDSFNWLSTTEPSIVGHM